MFKNLTVAKRLTLGFGAIVAIGVVIAAYAAMTMQALSADIEELSQNRMVKVAQFTQLKDNFQSIARAARNIVINTEPAFVADEKKKIAEARAENAEILAKLDKTITLPKGRELYKAITENRSAYNAALDKAIELALRGERVAAGAQLTGEVRGLQEVVFKATDESMALQRTVANGLAEKARATSSFGLKLMVALTLGMVAIGLLVGWLITRNLKRSLGAEPAALSDAVSRVADGDLSQRLMLASGDTTSVMASVVRMQESLVRVVASVRSNSESVATASSQIAQGNQDLSQRTEEQASALQQTAATMEQLNTTVRNNADNAKHANELAQGASGIAAQGGEVVGQVIDTMQGISESSRKIGDIIGVIDGIAFQTNILALNAAVEAARAGEQGRGFAVVASEVRGLAQRSAEAAKEIKSLISRSMEQVEQGTVLVNHAGKTMGEIVGSIRNVSNIVAEITSASAEQSSGISQVGDAVGQMDRVTQQNAALVEESAAAAESLKGQAQQLVQAVAVFKLSHQDGIASGVSMSVSKATSVAPAARVASTVPAKPKKATRAALGNSPMAAKQTQQHADPALVSAPAIAGGDDDWSSF